MGKPANISSLGLIDLSRGCTLSHSKFLPVLCFVLFHEFHNLHPSLGSHNKLDVVENFRRRCRRHRPPGAVIRPCSDIKRIAGHLFSVAASDIGSHSSCCHCKSVLSVEKARRPGPPGPRRWRASFGHSLHHNLRTNKGNRRVLLIFTRISPVSSTWSPGGNSGQNMNAAS